MYIFDFIDEFKGDNNYLSNFAPYSFTDENGVEWPTSEHYFQAHKTLDEKEREWVRSAPTPGSAKKRGRKVTLRPDWDQVKDEIMFIAIRLKFEQYPWIARKLQETGDKILIEGNYWHDNYWGQCKCDKCKDKLGKNRLGFALMKLREYLNQKGDKKMLLDRSG